MSSLPPDLAALSDCDKIELSKLLLESIEPGVSGLTGAQLADLQRRIFEDANGSISCRTWEEIKAEYAVSQ